MRYQFLNSLFVPAWGGKACLAAKMPRFNRLQMAARVCVFKSVVSSELEQFNGIGRFLVGSLGRVVRVNLRRFRRIRLSRRRQFLDDFRRGVVQQLKHRFARRGMQRAPLILGALVDGVALLDYKPRAKIDPGLATDVFESQHAKSFYASATPAV